MCESEWKSGLKSKIAPFERYSVEYDTWFDEPRHRSVYEAELNAVRAVLPETGSSIEIGVGSGRFAAPLGITMGLEPASGLIEMAKTRGIAVIRGIGEALPFTDSSFELVLMVTTICFLGDPEKAFREVYRVLRPHGYFIVAFIDRDSPLGQIYSRDKVDSPFYRVARFYNTEEVTAMLRDAGFIPLVSARGADTGADAGAGAGSFIVLKVKK